MSMSSARLEHFAARPACARSLAASVLTVLIFTGLLSAARAQDTSTVPAPQTPASPTTAPQTSPQTSPAPPPDTTTPLPPGNGNSDSGSVRYKTHINFGPEVGIYFPTSGKTRSAFGDNWFSIGLGIGQIQRASYTGRFQLDLGLFGTSHTNHQVLMLPVGVSYRRALSRAQNLTPYAGASADLVLTQLRSDPDNIVSRIRGTGGGSLFLGTTIQSNAYIEARYLLIGDIRGYDLSGLNLSAGFRF